MGVTFASVAPMLAMGTVFALLGAIPSLDQDRSVALYTIPGLPPASLRH